MRIVKIPCYVTISRERVGLLLPYLTLSEQFFPCDILNPRLGMLGKLFSGGISAYLIHLIILRVPCIEFEIREYFHSF